MVPLVYGTLVNVSWIHTSTRESQWTHRSGPRPVLHWPPRNSRSRAAGRRPQPEGRPRCPRPWPPSLSWRSAKSERHLLCHFRWSPFAATVWYQGQSWQTPRKIAFFAARSISILSQRLLLCYELWKQPFNSSLCAVTADSKSRWPRGREAFSAVSYCVTGDLRLPYPWVHLTTLAHGVVSQNDQGPDPRSPISLIPD